MKKDDAKKPGKINLELITFDPSDIQFLPDKVPNTNVGLYVPYGTYNDFPEVVNTLYFNSGTFASIVNSMCDYVAGSDIRFNDAVIAKLHFNKQNELKTLVKRCIFDKILMGGFCVKVIYNLNKEIAKIEWMDIRDVRLSVNTSKAYYALNFGKGRRGELQVYSTMNHFTVGEDEHNHFTCLYYHRGRSRGIYPVPMYQGALRSIQTDCEINKFNLRAISSGLAAASIVNIPDGNSYTEDEKRTIERKFKDHFCGSDNADSFILAFNPSPDNKVEIERIEDDAFADKYEVLSKLTIKNIFSAFRMSPVLAGYLQENIGFNRQEFVENFAIFNQTVIQPLQQEIMDAFDDIFGIEGSLVIEPYKINPEINE